MQDQQQQRANGLGVAALVLGIIAVVFAFIPLVGVFLAIPLAIIGIGLAIPGLVRGIRRADTGKGTSIAGGILGISSIILASAMTAAVFGGGTSGQPVASGVSTSTSSNGSGTGDQVKSVPYGETGKVGDLSVTLTDVATQQSIGPDMMGEEARGKYVLVEVKEKNTGSTPQGFGNVGTTAFDAQGNQYQSDPAGFMLESNQGSGGLMSPINPGGTATGTLVFDVPEDRNLTRLNVTAGFLDQPRNFQLPS